MKIEGYHTRKTDQAKLQKMLARQTGLGAFSWFYQMTWQPKSLEETEEELNGSWLIVSDGKEVVEDLQAKIVKPEQAVSAIEEKLPEGILWFASGKDSLKHAFACVQAIGKLETKPRLFFITRGIQPIGPIADLDNATFNGFYRTLKLEIPNLACRHIDLGPNEKFPLNELLTADEEGQIAYYEGVRYVPRLLPAKDAKRSGKKLLNPITPAFQLETTAKGSLENLYLMPNDALSSPGPNEITIEVMAAGLNFRDVLNAMGLYPGDPGPLGGECAGVVAAVGEDVTEFKVGDPVVGFASGCFASFITASKTLFTLIPSNLTFPQAAAIPIVFSTAYYALITLAKLKAGEKVLIHAAAGGVGLAAIQIAQQVGAEIYATASSPEKHAHLRSMGISHIYNSRNLDYADEILSDTKGKGVDVVLNSLTGEGFVTKTISACHENARFVEIGKRNIWSKEVMFEARPDIEYFILALDEMMLQNPKEVHGVLHIVIDQFAKNQFKPLSSVCFSILDAKNAFEYLQRAKNIGKVVLTFSESKQIKIDPAGSYLITGGLGGLGLKVAEWLVKQGAQHLVLAGRNISKPIDIPNVKIETAAVDISKKAAVDGMIQKFGKEWPELKGIIHAAGIIEDALLSSQDWSKFERVFAPKVQGSWNLHESSLNKSLDFFVLFSSVASSLGSPGQINYSSANAYMDALAYFRRENGLPALTVSWGPWSEVGMALDNLEYQRQKGFVPISPEGGINALEKALQIENPHVVIANVDWKTVASKQTKPLSLTNDLMPTLSDKKEEPQAILANLKIADTIERENILRDHIIQLLRKVLGLPAKDVIQEEQSFLDMGMDSLMAVELKNHLQSLFGTLYMFPGTFVFDHPNLRLLSDFIKKEVFPLLASVEVIPQEKEAEKVKGTIQKEEYGFNNYPEIAELKTRNQIYDKLKIPSPYFRIDEGIANNYTLLNGTEYINYLSFNYLCLTEHPEVIKAASEALTKYGTSISSSRVMSAKPIHWQLEKELADFIGTEASIISVGGHSTNETTISHLFKEQDLILCDSLDHNSIFQGAFHSGAKVIPFRHNDMYSLEHHLKENRNNYRRCLIVAEGVYSMEGDICNLKGLVELKKEYQAYLMIDEAHSIGVLGSTGRGVSEYFGIPASDVDIWMGTVSKALASCGGYIAGSKMLIEYLRYTAPGFVFATGISPANCAAALASLRVIKGEPSRVKRLQERAKLFHELVLQEGFNTGSSKDSPIISIIVGDQEKCYLLSHYLFERGINAFPITYPAVPVGTDRVRFMITSEHTEAEFQQTLIALVEGRTKLKF